MDKLLNRIIFWWYRKEIEQLIDAFLKEATHVQISKTMEAKDLIKLYNEWGWSEKKANRIFNICQFFGIIEQCQGRLFKNRLAYRINSQFLK